MTVDEFRKSAGSSTEPSGLTLPLRALWWVATGQWKAAHDLIDEDETPDGMWVHAHLHRQEGDISNARYWYGRAGKPEFNGPIEAEWDEIVSALLVP